MAPTPHKQDPTTNLFSSTAPNLLTTMTSPNLHTAASILRNQSTRTTNSFSSDSTNLSGMKTVYVGKDQHPVTIMQMAHVNEVVRKKAASFENPTCGAPPYSPARQASISAFKRATISGCAMAKSSFSPGSSLKLNKRYGAVSHSCSLR